MATNLFKTSPITTTTTTKTTTPSSGGTPSVSGALNKILGSASNIVSKVANYISGIFQSSLRNTDTSTLQRMGSASGTMSSFLGGFLNPPSKPGDLGQKFSGLSQSLSNSKLLQTITNLPQSISDLSQKPLSGLYLTPPENFSSRKSALSSSIPIPENRGSSVEGIVSPPSDSSQKKLPPQKVYLTSTDNGFDIIKAAPSPKNELVFEADNLKNQLSQTITNIPDGTETFVYRDPLGGQTEVFGHLIKPGETLSKIAKQYGVSIDELERLNKGNERALKSRDLIIAGENLLIPVKKETIPLEDQLKSKITIDIPKTTQDINQRQRELYENLQQGKLPKESLTPQDYLSLTFNLLQDELNAIQQKYDALNQFYNPNFYQQKYNELVQQSGLEQLYQRYYDLGKILNSTREDVLREAAFAGGLATQSQVEEIVAWRQSLIKDEMKSLADLIDAKERLIDKTMKYVEMDRKTLSDYLDNVFNLKDARAKAIKNALDWGYNYWKDIKDNNKRKLEYMVNNGALAEISLDYLAKFADPTDFLYTGYDFEELLALRRVSQIVSDKKQEELRRLEESLNREKEILKLKRQGFELEKEKFELKKQQEDEFDLGL